MISNFDISNLNSSIERAGQSFADRRQEDRRQQLIENQLAHEHRMEAGEEARGRATEAHWKKEEEQIGLHNAFQQLIESSKGLKESMVTLAEQVKEGSMDPEDATAYFQKGIDMLPNEMKQHLMASPEMNAAYNGDLDWSKINASADLQPVSFTTPDGKTVSGVYSRKSGAFHQAAPDKGPVRIGSQTDKDTGVTKYIFGDPNKATQGAAIKLVRDANGNLVPAGQAVPAPTTAPGLQLGR